MPGCRWFEGAELNYAEHALRHAGARAAVICLQEDGRRGELSWDALRDQVARAAAGLSRLGVQRGDRVAALLPNGPEALIAFLASASLGATWSSCAPEFGVQSVLDRFTQIAPKVLLAVDSYRYGGKRFERASAVQEIARALPSLAMTVIVSDPGDAAGALLPVGMITFAELTREHVPLMFAQVPFDHPLWILYSSGTTGLPKPIVQGHGGIVLEHFKVLALHCELGEHDRALTFTTTGWMMWNFLISGLLVGSTVVLYDGHPAYPDPLALFRLLQRERITYFGTSAPFLTMCSKTGVSPRSLGEFPALRMLGSTGAPLPVEGFGWVYEQVKQDVQLSSFSGGTDVCTAFIGSCALSPVWAGELSCRLLGCKVEAFDASGQPVIDEVGELVISAPMPSMPLYFLHDSDGSRLQQSYFAEFPGVWRHGDWIKLRARGSCVIYGRSDSTLNRDGVRMGTSEFYRVVEGIAGIQDSLVIDTSALDHVPNKAANSGANKTGELWLFVVLAPGRALDAALDRELRSMLRSALSPRHVPDRIVAIQEVPKTLNGKKLEVPIKKLLMGVPKARALNPGTLLNPNAVDALLHAAGLG